MDAWINVLIHAHIVLKTAHIVNTSHPGCHQQIVDQARFADAARFSVTVQLLAQMRWKLAAHRPIQREGGAIWLQPLMEAPVSRLPVWTECEYPRALPGILR